MLLRDYGWAGRLIETNFDLWLECNSKWEAYPKVKSICSHVDKYNIHAFVKENCDLLSLDTDGSDYKLFMALKVKPKIVIIEIDSSFTPDRSGFNSDGAAGYYSMVEAALAKGYFVLCHTGNLVLIDEQYKHLFPEVAGHHPLHDCDLYFNRGWLAAA